jgi:hypothetical protein
LEPSQGRAEDILTLPPMRAVWKGRHRIVSNELLTKQ